MSRILGVPFQSPLRYMPERTALIPIVRVDRLPLTSDQNFPVCQFWLIDRNPTTGTEGDLYYLERFDSSGDAIWTKLADISGVAGLQQITGDTGFAVIDAGDNIDVVGNAAQGVSTAGAANTVTITVADATALTKGVASYNATDFTVAAGNVTLGDTIVKLVSADTGDATPVGNAVIITAGTGIITSAAGNTVTISATGALAGSFVTDAGTATPAVNVINILGGTGVNTAGAGNTVTVNIDSPVTVANGGTGLTSLTDGGILLGSGTGAVTVTAQPTDGQLLIGVTGSDPVLATLTDGTGISIVEGAGTITIGLDGTITVANGGTGATSFTPYTVICAGTTATGALQNVASVGTSGQVLTSNGAGALPTFQDAPGIDWTLGATHNLLYSDFIVSHDTYPFVGGSNIISATNNRLGIRQLTSSYWSAPAWIGTGSSNIYIGNGEITMQSDWCLTAYGSSGARTAIGFGLMGGTFAATSAAGDTISIRASSSYGANYYCMTSTSGGVTITDTGVAATTDMGTFHRFLIVVNTDATSVAFYVDDVLKATHTTNIPATSSGMQFGGFSARDSSTYNYGYYDYLFFDMTYASGPRT